MFLNIPSLGATYTDTVLPSFWRFLNDFWIGAETVNAERSILYFGGQDVGTDLLRLLAWTAVIVALLLLPVSRKLRRQSNRRPCRPRSRHMSLIRQSQAGLTVLRARRSSVLAIGVTTLAACIVVGVAELLRPGVLES